MDELLRIVKAAVIALFAGLAIWISLPFVIILALTLWYILSEILFPTPKIEYQNYQCWTAQEIDLFFDCSSEYYGYEFGHCNMVGRLRTESGREIELIVLIPGSTSGDVLEFYRIYPDELSPDYFSPKDYFRYDARSANEDSFTSSLVCNKTDFSLPERITFTCEEITPEELYRPAWLGEKDEAPDG